MLVMLLFRLWTRMNAGFEDISILYEMMENMVKMGDGFL
jgi:hypothetical protein